ncbi:glycosyltransferase EpsD [Neobacillus niacini]|uniref:glycosyltransferase family 4 protein n=1 Tax=Neobacillus niacini TaxID=86668 RepID=UPI002784C3AE|nr:glycosyltransferase family 4 protein [Neobacillus niacini]MDQ1000332.1 glycosyltransferase EpsD [Neobacillus niacini]
MKILYVTTISNTVNAFLIPHIKLLIEKGNQVDIACNIVQEVSPELKKLNCKIHNIEFQRSPFGKSNSIAYKRIKRIVMEEGYNLVHTHTPVASFLTRFACRNIPNLKMLYTAHGFHFFKGAPLKNWIIYYPIEKLSAKWTDGIITINEEDYLSAKKIMKKDRDVFKVNGVGIDTKKFSPQTQEIKQKLRKKYGYNDSDFILIYVGELSYRKHQDLLIDTVGELNNKIPNLKLLLVGEGPLQLQYQQRVNKLGLNDNVEFLGFRNDISNLMSLSDMAVSSSRQEGLPVNIMESMATGLPVIVTDCRGNSDLVIHNKNGYLIKKEDIKSFAKTIEELYKSDESIGKFGKAGLKLVEKYSLNNVLEEMENLYFRYLK